MKPGMKGMMLLLLIAVAEACSESREPVDVSGKDAGAIVAKDMVAILTDIASRPKSIITGSEPSAVETTEDSFRKIAKKHIPGNVTLYPQLTYRISYKKSGLLSMEDAQCDAMAYAIIQEGKLYGDGLVLSQTVGWNSNTITEYSEKAQSLGLQIWIGLGIALLLFLVYKLFIAKSGSGRSFKSEAEKMYIGDSVTCEICGRKYYRLKTSRLPVELIGKYSHASVVTCRRCGRVYCHGGIVSSCSMMMGGGCKCSRGQRFEAIAEAHVTKDY
jgi:ribosomal protein L37E